MIVSVFVFNFVEWWYITSKWCWTSICHGSNSVKEMKWNLSRRWMDNTLECSVTNEVGFQVQLLSNNMYRCTFLLLRFIFYFHLFIWTVSTLISKTSIFWIPLIIISLIALVKLQHALAAGCSPPPATFLNCQTFS